MAKVFVDGDLDVLDQIEGALRAAGLASVDVELVRRGREVAPFRPAPGGWATLADVAVELPYAEWRDEVWCLAEGGEPGTASAPGLRPEPAVSGLLRAG